MEFLTDTINKLAPNAIGLIIVTAVFVKWLVDGIKSALPRMPGWGVLLSAYLVSLVLMIAAYWAGDEPPLTAKEVLGLFLASIVSFTSAVGINRSTSTVKEALIGGGEDDYDN